MASYTFLARAFAAGLSGAALVACTSALGTFTIDDSLANEGGVGNKEGGSSQADGGSTIVDGGSVGTDGGSVGKVDAGPPVCLSTGFRFAFVTTDAVVGSFGGSGSGQVQAANTRCASAAADAKLPGKYVAWLSDSNGVEPGQKFLNGGTPIFMRTKAETCLPVLMNPASYNGTLDRAIDRDELGDAVGVVPVWTATKPDGTYIGSNALMSTCANWNDASDAGIVKGGVGSTGAAGQAWTDNGSQACNLHAHFYCFQTN